MQNNISILGAFCTFAGGVSVALINKGSQELSLIVIAVVLVIWMIHFYAHFKSNKKSSICLEKHIFFDEIDGIIEYTLKEMRLINPKKQVLVRKYFTLYMQNMRDKYLQVCKLSIKTADELNKANQKAFRDAISELHIKAEGEGIPKIFIEKMEEWRFYKVETAFQGIYKIINSETLSTLQDKQSCILYMFLNGIRLLLLEIEQQVDQMNGELEKVI